MMRGAKARLQLPWILRTLGSNGYLYADESLPLPERATRLLRDFLAALHDGLLDAVTAPGTTYDFTRLSPLVDGLGQAVTGVVVRESVERTHST